jgi:hypothetical protein
MLQQNENRNLIDEVARLKELTGRRQAILVRQHDTRTPNYALIERLDIERDLLNAISALLDALGEVRAGDADILYWMLTGIGDDPTQEEINDVLHRYRDIARKMEANR